MVAILVYGVIFTALGYCWGWMSHRHSELEKLREEIAAWDRKREDFWMRFCAATKKEKN